MMEIQDTTKDSLKKEKSNIRKSIGRNIYGTNLDYTQKARNKFRS